MDDHEIEFRAELLDRRRSEIEYMLSTLPPPTANCCDHGRELRQLLAGLAQLKA